MNSINHYNNHLVPSSEIMLMSFDDIAKNFDIKFKDQYIKQLQFLIDVCFEVRSEKELIDFYLSIKNPELKLLFANLIISNLYKFSDQYLKDVLNKYDVFKLTFIYHHINEKVSNMIIFEDEIEDTFDLDDFMLDQSAFQKFVDEECDISNQVFGIIYPVESPDLNEQVDAPDLNEQVEAQDLNNKVDLVELLEGNDSKYNIESKAVYHRLATFNIAIGSQILFPQNELEKNYNNDLEKLIISTKSDNLKVLKRTCGGNKKKAQKILSEMEFEISEAEFSRIFDFDALTEYINSLSVSNKFMSLFKRK